MDNRFIKSCINITLLLGGMLTLYFFQFGLRSGLSIAGGVLFSIANIYLLWRLIQEIITSEERKKTNIAGLAVLKFIFLWGAFIVVLAFDWASPIHFAIGFTVLLFVFAMKGFGGWLIRYFGISEKKPTQE